MAPLCNYNLPLLCNAGQGSRSARRGLHAHAAFCDRGVAGRATSAPRGRCQLARRAAELGPCISRATLPQAGTCDWQLLFKTRDRSRQAWVLYLPQVSGHGASRPDATVPVCRAGAAPVVGGRAGVTPDAKHRGRDDHHGAGSEDAVTRPLPTPSKPRLPG